MTNLLARDWLLDRSTAPMEPGGILWHAPSTVFQAPGGGENQLVQTGAQLEEQGVSIRLFSRWVDRIGQARLVHLFGMSREGLEVARLARSLGVPVILSPICWFEPAALRALAKSPIHSALDLAKCAARRACPQLPSWRRDLLRIADMLLPNSQAEANQLVAMFGTDPRKIHVVPNGVQPGFASADPSLFHQAYGDSEFVLYAGRIEPRKNVLGLIESLRGSGLPLVVLGESPPGHEAYLAVCRQAGQGFVCWLGRVEHDNPLLASAYSAARVFALPSWFETPGLAALEAGLAGTAVVITPFGCTHEYFGARVLYARPDRPKSIRRAIESAWEDGPNPELAQHVAEHFPWSKVARITAEVYEHITA